MELRDQVAPGLCEVRLDAGQRPVHPWAYFRVPKTAQVRQPLPGDPSLTSSAVQCLMQPSKGCKFYRETCLHPEAEGSSLSNALLCPWLLTPLQVSSSRFGQETPQRVLCVLHLHTQPEAQAGTCSSRLLPQVPVLMIWTGWSCKATRSAALVQLTAIL